MAFAQTDLVDYIFQFPDFGSALRDPTVGSTFITPLKTGFFNKALIVYRNTAVDSVDPESGYWFLLTTTGFVPALENHPQVQIINDLTVMNAGGASVFFSNFDTTFTNIVASTYGLYCTGLQAGAPSNGLIAEDGVTFLIAEDGVTFLVQE